jgi:cysteine desulfurase
VKKEEYPIYLDYSATTPIDPQVASVIEMHYRNTYGNASSIHSYGRTAKVVLEESREIIARSIGAETAEIFFTAGGTESDNHALIGTAFAQRRKNGKDHIIVSAIEHHAVLDCTEYLKNHDYHITCLPVNKNGIVNVAELERQIGDNTALVSIMHANNETGVIQPIKEIADLLKENKIIFHSDTVQSIGKIPVKVNDLGMDILAVSAHKIYGPKGVGAIYIRRGTEIDALLHGGSQERKNRAGTENVPLIAGFAKAIELAEAGREELFYHTVKLRTILKDIIQNSISNVLFNSYEGHSIPHIFNISLDSSAYNIESETMLLNMDMKGVAVSSGSACTSGSVQPSHVLLAMGRDPKTTQATIRFSLGKFTTIEEVEKAGRIFCTIAQSFRKK